MIRIALILCSLLLALAGCKKSDVKPAGLQVVTSLFPLFDFARSIAGNKASVSLLLPPGMEPHTFEPKPEDMIRVSRSGLFIYTGRYMEPWAETLVKGLENKTLCVVEAGKLATYRAADSDDDHHGTKNGEQCQRLPKDPHIWLDFQNAAIIVDAILEGFITADPANTDFYRKKCGYVESASDRS